MYTVEGLWKKAASENDVEAHYSFHLETSRGKKSQKCCDGHSWEVWQFLLSREKYSTAELSLIEVQLQNKVTWRRGKQLFLPLRVIHNYCRGKNFISHIEPSTISMSLFPPLYLRISQWNNLFLQTFSQREENGHLLLYIMQRGKHQLELPQEEISVKKILFCISQAVS